jgi:hypothetical protein
MELFHGLTAMKGCDKPFSLLSGIYPREMKTVVHTKICTEMFTAALLVTIPNWKSAHH